MCRWKVRSKQLDCDLIEPILVGPEERIRDVAKQAGLDICRNGDRERRNTVIESAAKAVELVTAGRVEALMKGQPPHR